VPKREALPVEFLFEGHADDPRLRAHRHVTWTCRLNLTQTFQIDDHAFAVSDRAAANAASCTVRNDGRTGLTSPLNQPQHFVLTLGLHDRGGQMMTNLSTTSQDDSARPTIVVVRKAIRSAREHVRPSDDFGEIVFERPVQR